MNYFGHTPFTIRGPLRITLQLKRRDGVKQFFMDGVQSPQSFLHKDNVLRSSGSYCRLDEQFRVQALACVLIRTGSGSDRVCFHFKRAACRSTRSLLLPVLIST